MTASVDHIVAVERKASISQRKNVTRWLLRLLILISTSTFAHFFFLVRWAALPALGCTSFSSSVATLFHGPEAETGRELEFWVQDAGHPQKPVKLYRYECSKRPRTSKVVRRDGFKLNQECLL